MCNQIKQYALSLSLGLYFISLWLPCYAVPNDESYPGFIAVVFGWLMLGAGTVGIGWLANPLVVISWIISRRLPNMSLLFSAIAFAIALAQLFLTSDKGFITEIHHYRIGYWIWLISILVASVVGFTNINLSQSITNDN